jgi:hypothetical protein
MSRSWTEDGIGDDDPESMAATEVLMEPENRPYVEPDTKPGDAGTEEWADTLPGSGEPVRPGPLANPVGTTEDHGVVAGSPADEFINDPDAIAARNEKGDRARRKSA